ncbi:hypothetical protein A3D77_00825 [Candidatus Gottesmanbacteria bacterium RIFCSPHIGHO2_02_FULL_39_11]|uniref:Uncharacterized protein n=1 Tax=Candidatus Gottesmanbacteria bacterium RIFCSPHIGHO2_02_FULL_39_11 TaxID=1798382 RepID=A0A1F5ZPL6_9BACT|nr:MAG: hypothetical protein A3D77_00825 [Candidatus Gottesmanbacteria bacterium RIFCSPHIGHO2_02_FULL_39_11]
MMQRTTLRLNKNLKKEAERLALEKETTLQTIFNEALAMYIKTTAKKKARKIIVKTHDLGVPLDNLTRKDFYPDPDPSLYAG